MIVVFDMGGVFFNDGLEEVKTKANAAFGINPKEIDDALRGPFAKEYRIGEIEPEEFWRRMKDRFKLDDIELFRRIFFCAYRPQPAIISIITDLKKNNNKVGFHSNGPRDRSLYLDELYHFRDLFDFGYFSYEAHAWKPEMHFYRYLIQHAGIDPSDTIYVDDKEDNLVPASALGMEGVLFESAEKLRQLFIQRGMI
ncbi:MAG: HAD-IA family hydrolase [archaeon]